MQPEEILKKYWGFDEFRSLQKEIVDQPLKGKDALALLPTGGGKSICFQVPAMAMDGICIVVSPLLALIKDQVQALIKNNINAKAVISGMSKKEIDITLDNCIYGKVKFLYVSPERIVNDLFLQRVQKMNVNMLVVDEAHCISKWGYDFRPSYLNISELRKLFKTVPVMALTATATKEVVKDIQEKLEFKEENVIRKSFERENIALVVRPNEDKNKQLESIIGKVQGSGIIYAYSRRRTQEISDYLSKKGISVDYYHAGLEMKIREKKQHDWMVGKTRIIVSTNAFGMGIDKEDVRFVIHMDLPDSIEAYYQEAGRGGRDGKKAFAVVLATQHDIANLVSRVEGAFPPMDEIKRAYKAIANYLRLAIGSGEGTYYNFNLNEFCDRFNFKQRGFLNCLKFIERGGYLTSNFNQKTLSKILFIAPKQQLYNFQVKNEKYDKLIKTLLRSYTSIFEDFVQVNEEEIAKRCEISIQKVTQYLNHLHKNEIIQYLPTSKQPQICFTPFRIDVKEVRISRIHYDDRKSVAIKQMNAVIDYMSNDRVCRSKFLLAHFDEKKKKDCGKCDVCLENIKKTPPQQNEEFEGKIRSKLTGNNLNLDDLMLALDDDEGNYIDVIRLLLDKNVIAYNKQNELYIVK
ncbi:MAG: RecQ family ATP-dependent DNA helicase [Flavobacteriales bacterium]|nr:RecQ family ATP-dependent DNA helicase [Flavobacteriales bacterium]